ncbi:hypothetical protein D3C78_1052170 [compost metagenome]
MSDEDEHDDSLMDRYRHHLMGLYRNPLLTTSAPRQNSSVSILGIMVAGLLIWGAFRYWQYVLLALLGIAALYVIVFLIAGLMQPAKPRKTHDRKQMAFETAKTPTQIRITINSSPEFERYFWSADDDKLVEQWRRYYEEGVKPIRRNKAAGEPPKSTGQGTPSAKATRLSPEAQRIVAQINASPRLAQHAWHEHETGLLEQWQRYQTLGQLPIRRSKLERRMTKSSARQPGGCR